MPRPGATDEDDGWVTTFVYDASDDTSSIHIYETKSMSRVAKVGLPRRVPVGFHATWVPGDLIGRGIV